MYFGAAYGKEYHDSLGDIWGPFLVDRFGKKDLIKLCIILRQYEQYVSKRARQEYS